MKLRNIVSKVREFLRRTPQPSFVSMKKVLSARLDSTVKAQDERIAKRRDEQIAKYGDKRGKWRGTNPARCRCVPRTITSPAICFSHHRMQWCPRHRLYTCLACGGKDRLATIKKAVNDECQPLYDDNYDWETENLTTSKERNCQRKLRYLRAQPSAPTSCT